MENKKKTVSKNSFDLLSIAGAWLKGKKKEAFLASLIYMSVLLLTFIIPYIGWAVALVMYGWLTTGLLVYFRKLFNNEKPKLSELFTQTKELAHSTLLGVTLVLLTILTSVLFVIPGIIFISYYSLSLYFLETEKCATIGEAMHECGAKMKGHKTDLISYKVIYYLIYALLIGIAVVTSVIYYGLLDTNAVLAVILFIVTYSLFILGMAYTTIFYQAANTVFFEEVILKQEAPAQEVKVAEPVAVAPVVATPAQEVKKPVAKKAATTKAPVKKVEATPAKTTTKAPATKTAAVKVPAKTAAEKPAVKKTTTTKTTTKK